MKTFNKIPAQVLRRRGYSLSDLVSKFGISKSTASLWTSGVQLSQLGVDRLEEKRRLGNLKGHQILHTQKLQRIKSADKEADTLLKNIDLNKQTELIALVMMYWCEGIKSDQAVGFTNSDPKLARAFILMLEDLFEIDPKRWRICVHLHDYHDEKKILVFWSDTLNVPLTQFIKPFKKESNHIRQRKDYKGCVHIKYHDAHIARVLLAFAKKFINLYI